MPKLGDIYSNIKNGTVSNSALEIELECSSVKNNYTRTPYYRSYRDVYIEFGRLSIIEQYVFFVKLDEVSVNGSGFYNASRYHLIKYDTENNSFQILHIFYLNNNENLRPATLCSNGKDTIYLFGAGEKIRKFRKENNWAIESLTTTIPRSVNYCSSMKIDNYIYLLGGGSNKIEKFDLEKETFETFNYYLPFDVDKSNGIAKDDNGNIYIVGNVSYKFDTKTNESSTFKPLKIPKNYNGLSYCNGFLYSYSTDTNLSTPTSYIERLDLSDDSCEWEIITDDNIPNGMGLNFPSSQGFLYTEYKNEIIVFGQGNDTGCFRHRFGLDSDNIEIRYNITSDGSEPEIPTEATGTIYTEPINVSEVGNYKLKAVAFEKV